MYNDYDLEPDIGEFILEMSKSKSVDPKVRKRFEDHISAKLLNKFRDFMKKEDMKDASCTALCVIGIESIIKAIEIEKNDNGNEKALGTIIAVREILERTENDLRMKLEDDIKLEPKF